MAKKILGLDISDSAVTAVQVRSDLKGYQVLGCERVETEGETGFDDALKVILGRIDFDNCICLTAISEEHVSYRNLQMPFKDAKKIRQAPFEISYDRDFEGVIAGCAETGNDRRSTWINGPIRDAYRRLFDIGHCHTVEARSGRGLAGGLYGVTLGRAFFGESMFSRERDASKICLVYLVEHLRPWLKGRPAGQRVFPMPRKPVKLIQADLKAARKAWLNEAQADKEREKRKGSDFLAYCDHANRVADFHSLRHTFITRLASAGTDDGCGAAVSICATELDGSGA